MGAEFACEQRRQRAGGVQESLTAAEIKANLSAQEQLLGFSLLLAHLSNLFSSARRDFRWEREPLGAEQLQKNVF